MFSKFLLWNSQEDGEQIFETDIPYLRETKEILKKKNSKNMPGREIQKCRIKSKKQDQTPL